MELRTHDMYGHKIVPISGGWGISLSHFSVITSEGKTPERPCWTFFHESDGFQQSLFSVDIDPTKGDMPQLLNTFHYRIGEVFGTGCEMTIWKSFLDNRRCAEHCEEGSYFCFKHQSKIGGVGLALRQSKHQREFSEEQGRKSRERRMEEALVGLEKAVN